MNSLDRKLYDRLVAEGRITEEALAPAVKNCGSSGSDLYTCLLEEGLLNEDTLLTAMSAVTGIPYVNLHTVSPEEAAVNAVSPKFTWHYKFMPLKLEGNILTIAIGKPLSVNVQDELRLMLGYRMSFVLARKDQITELLKRHYGLGADTVGRMVEKDEEITSHEIVELPPEVEDIEKMAGDASVVKLVNQIILEAYRKRATDIHIEPFRGKLRLRYRIDGVLQDQKVPSEVDRFLLPILSRIKIMSNLNIVERRVPQDGRAMVKTQEGMLDLRVSFMPTPHGESVVIRVLPTGMFFSLKNLGLSRENFGVFETLIRKPSGIIFVTGPTGSGKTTTLYACIREVNKVEKKIITIEDPIEYEIENITQIQVNEASGLTFARGMRSMLRHDPDIMMVGEVRDRETADIAIRVALTGHLVLSTLHTNDAATGVTRLVDIGIEPYLVSSSVQAFVAQRLVRVICSNCKTEYTDLNPEIRRGIAESLDLGFHENIKVFRGKGCENCNYTGFYGRTAIYEILLVDREIKRLINEKAPASVIKERAVARGMKTLLQDGWEKVVKGITTPEEVINVCQDLEIMPAHMTSSRVISPAGKEEEDEAVVTDTEKDVCVETGHTSGTGPVEEIPVLPERRPGDKRLYVRVPIRIPVQYRIVKKEEGDIIELHERSSNEQAVYENIFTEDIFTRKVPEGKQKEDVYEQAVTSSINISAGGMSFESRYMIPLNSTLEIKMTLPGSGNTVQCLARIVRLEKNLPHCFYIVVCYLDMSGSDRKMLDDFIKRESDRQRIMDIKRD